MKEVAHILPRVECILFQGIDFNLCVDIPHNYVPKLFRASLNLKTDEVDRLYVPNAEHPDPRKPSELVRLFLHFCMGSFICVDHPPKVVAGAAVLYALRVTGLVKDAHYKASWLRELEFSEEEIEEITTQRKFVAHLTHRDAKDHSRSPTIVYDEKPKSPVREKRERAVEEEEAKRRRVLSDVPVGRPQPIVAAPAVKEVAPVPLFVSSVEARPAPIVASSSPAPIMPRVSSPAPILVSNSPAPIMPRVSSPAPIMSSNSPAPIMSSNSPAPIMPRINSPTPIMPSNSPAAIPLFPAPSDDENEKLPLHIGFGTEEEPVGLFPFSAPAVSERRAGLL